MDTIVFQFLVTVVALLLTACLSCPGSPAALFHAKCKMTVIFDQGCSRVKDEMDARISSEYWIDPHNGGDYSSLETTTNDATETWSGSRLTGDGHFTDLFDFEVVASKDKENDGGGCVVRACSESQVMSGLDFSTNYCNLRNLYCNSEEGCEVMKYELKYEEVYQDCWQRTKSKCLVVSETA